MVIKTKSLNEYRALFGLVAIRGNAKYGSVHLSFEDKKMIFHNNTTFCSIDLDFSGEPETKSATVVDGLKLFSIFSSYEEVEFDGETFTADGNKFKLATIGYEPEVPGWANSEDIPPSQFFLTQDLKAHMKRAKAYASEVAALNGVFIQGDNLVAMQPSRLYQATLKDTYDEINLPMEFIQILEEFPPSLDTELVVQNLEEGQRIRFRSGGVTILQTVNVSMGMPVAVDDENFVSSYDHKAYFTVPIEGLKSTLNFLSPFVQNIVNTIFDLKFRPSSGEILFYINDTENEVEYLIDGVDYYDNEYFEGKSMRLSLAELRATLNDLDGDGVNIHFDDEKPAVKFIDSKSSDYFVVRARYSEG